MCSVRLRSNHGSSMAASPQNQKQVSRAFLQAKLRPLDVLVLAGMLICACTLTGFAGRFWWFLDLTTHFRFQYAVLLPFIAATCLIARRRVPAAIFLGFALLNWGVVLSQCWLGREAQMPPAGASFAKPLRLMLMNVNAENRRCDLALRCLREQKPDLVVLEEINDRWFQALGEIRTNYPWCVYDVRDDDFGIALLSRVPLQSSNIVFLGDAELPSAEVCFQWEGRRVTLLGTHPLPPGGAENSRARDVQLDAVAAELSACSGPALLLGDLNTTAWSYSFQRLLRRSGLRDSSRGRGFQPTWPTFFVPLYIPLDHCLVSSDCLVLNRCLGPRTGSDHLPLIVDVQLR